MVIISIYDLKPQRFRIPAALVLPDQILLIGINIGIAIIYDRLYIMSHEMFDNCRRAGGAASMKQYLLLSKRHIKYFLLFAHIFQNLH